MLYEFQDRHATGESEPIVDDVQNYQLLQGKEDNVHTMLKFKRKLVLCDKDDITITVRMFGVIINVLWIACSSFSQKHKVDNTGANANFAVFLFMCMNCCQ